MGGCASSIRRAPAEAVQQKPPAAPITGLIVDCGSGHASTFWYRLSPSSEVVQLRRSRLRARDDEPFKLAQVLSAGEAGPEGAGESTAAAQIAYAAAVIQAEIAAATEAHPAPDDGSAAQESLAWPSLLFVGATGGLREALADGSVDLATVDGFSRALRERFSASIPAVRFACLTGEQEAKWELEAARTIWRPEAESMFPSSSPDDGAAPAASSAASSFGVFSGGGQSMQVGMEDGVLLSWPFSTWCDALDEKKGAAAEAWREGTAWGAWEASLLDRIALERTRAVAPLDGAFLLTAMNQVACVAAGIAERPIRAAAAIAALRSALTQFRRGEGEACAAFLAARAHYKYNVARVTAMHLCRLAHALEQLFAPEARLYAADPKRAPLHCEWALGAFMHGARGGGGGARGAPAAAAAPP